MSGWANSDRRARLPADWPARVKQVKARAGGRCEWRLQSGARCPRAGRDVDHRRPGDDHSLRNLQLLCPHHHERKTTWEAVFAKKKRRPAKRAEERHPGLRPR